MARPRRRPATFADVVRLTAHLPEVEQSTSYGTPALKVRGKSFCRMWGDREYRRDGVDDTEVLVVFCDPEWKGVLIEGSGGVLFSTPHYDGYPAMLIRLADVHPDDLADHLEESYVIKAPASIRKVLTSDDPGGSSRINS